MNIICKKCNYILTNGEVTIHLLGAIAKFISTMFSYIPTTKSGLTSMQSKAEKLLLACANILEIRCPRCCTYEYWTYSEEIEKTTQEE